MILMILAFSHFENGIGFYGCVNVFGEELSLREDLLSLQEFPIFPPSWRVYVVF